MMLFVHLQAVGLHSHDPQAATNGHDHDHDHSNDHGPLSEELAYVWKCLVAYLAIYLFFIFESMVEMCGVSKNPRICLFFNP